jgi:hypothetical protein
VPPTELEKVVAVAVRYRVGEGSEGSGAVLDVTGEGGDVEDGGIVGKVVGDATAECGWDALNDDIDSGGLALGEIAASVDGSYCGRRVEAIGQVQVNGEQVHFCGAGLGI